MGLFTAKKPEKIRITTVPEELFESLNKKIDEKNELLRCGKCGKLLSKVSIEGKSLQHRGLKALIQGTISVKCVDCGTISRF